MEHETADPTVCIDRDGFEYPEHDEDSYDTCSRCDAELNY